MKNFATYLLAAAVGLTTLGCSKKEEAPSKTELLTNKNWIETAATVSPGIPVVTATGTTTVTDLHAQQKPCDLDDFIRFETPNVYKSDEGASKCNTADPQTTTGTWVYNGDQTIITITSAGGTPSSANVTELTDSSLKVSVSRTDATSGITYTYAFSYKKG